MANNWVWVAAAAGGAFVLYEWLKPSSTANPISPVVPLLPTGPISTACGAGTIWDAGSQTCIAGPILPPPPHALIPVLTAADCTGSTVWDAGSQTCIPGPILPPPPIGGCPPGSPECNQPIVVHPLNAVDQLQSGPIVVHPLNAVDLFQSGPILPPPPRAKIPSLQGLDGCYEWTKSCFDLADPCGDYGPQASCAPTVTWYWVLAGALAASLVLARLK